MLKQRLMTALILIPIVIWLIYGAPTFLVALVFGGIVMLGASEWAKMVPCTTTSSKALFLSTIAIALIAGYLLASLDVFVMLLSLLAVAWWVFVLLWLVCIRQTGHDENVSGGLLGFAQALSNTSLNKACIGVLILLPCFVALMYLHGSVEFGASYVFFCASLMWAADSGAYFAGKKWGQRKLAPGVSPGKTIEGVSGGLATSAVWTLLWMIFAGLGETSPLLFFLIAMITAVFSVAGDLFESLFKRIAKIKDSGQLLPGHGGVLDRIDSLTAGAPVFVLGLTMI